ncbi:DUF599 domain-containing protein [Myxococcota bacterium]|nr:DUF599 domain-containing protein [Myxococcota bacterium]
MTRLSTDLGTELAALILSLAMLAAYRAWMASRLRRDPLYTIQAYHQHVRRRWARLVLSDPSQAILGVQTLRNSTMGATFLASTVLLLLGGALSLVGRPDALGSLWPGIELEASRHPVVWSAKVLLLVGDLFVAVFAFVMAIRLYTHLGYQVSVPPEDDPRGASAERVVAMLDRAGRLFSLGLRACYLAMPAVLWLFGPLMLVLSTAVLVAVMAVLDRSDPGPAGD